MVTAVGWNMYNSSQVTTGPVLMGTTRGLIFEAELTTESGVFSSSIEKTWRQVYDIGYKGQAGQVTSISALEYHCVPKSKKYFVLATTVNRLYQFQGVMTDSGEHDKPQLMSIFSDYLHKSDTYLEIPNTLKYSTICFYYQPEKIGRMAAKLPLYPWSFGWMTSDGVFHGKIDPFEEDKMLNDTQLVAFHSVANDEDKPIDFILTQFHIVVAYRKFVKGICLLNEQVVFEDSLENPILGITRDAVTGTIYIFTDYTIHKYNLDQEDKHIWKVFLEMGKFDEALNYAGNDDWKTDQVLTKQGEHLLELKQYMKAAMIFAKTKSGKVETVALKFLLTKEHEALLLYLKSRLELVKAAEKAQLTMIIVWLVELHLNKMGTASNAPRQSADLTNEDIEAVADALDDQTSEELLALMKSPKVAECVNSNRQMFYSLLASHGDKTNLIKFANVLNDHDRVIQYHLQDKEFEPILKVLESQLGRGRPELFYKYGPRLMQAIPKRFVDSVMKQGQRLEPKKILNSLLMNAMPNQEKEAIRYLEFAVYNLESMHSGVHNYLLSLYIKHQPECVWPFLQKFQNDQIRYDVKYALRLCTETKVLHKESVYLYCVLDQLEEAVSLALNRLTLDDAKKCLNYAKNDEIKRKIWLQIAEYVVKNDNDIQSAMACLAECEDLVKIEDILPFFPDFVTIDHFKTPLCESLQKYTKHIAELKEEMNEAYKSAERIRSEMDTHKGKYTFVRATDKCCISNQYLLAKPFIVFPNCGHKFHTDSLIEALKPHLSAAKSRRIDEILKELAVKKKTEDDTQSIDSKSLKMSRKEMLRAELDDIIAAECIYCGSIMIDLIDKPFISDEDWDEVNAQWQ